MIAGIIIVLLIFIYAAFVIRKRANQIKNGQYCQCDCGCGCSDCNNKKQKL